MHLAKEIEPARLAQNNQTQSNVKLYPTVQKDQTEFSSSFSMASAENKCTRMGKCIDWMLSSNKFWIKMSNQKTTKKKFILFHGKLKERRKKIHSKQNNSMCESILKFTLNSKKIQTCIHEINFKNLQLQSKTVEN